GPVLMPAASCDHPIETPVRRTPLKTGTTTATKRFDKNATKRARGDKDVEMAWDGLVNGVTGATGGAAVHGANKHVPAGRSPNFAVEGPAQGVVYGGGRAIAKPLHDAIWPQEPNEPKPDGPKSESADTPQGPRKGSVKDVFG
ncbi:hypothetical protein, partial [Streptomyces sp. NPDC057579]|uniref:hypothetical protein n=1 Tax=Streptomyces sp. NPDC057579 TaxID=3346172 RepID=UPI0036D0997F